MTISDYSQKITDRCHTLTNLFLNANIFHQKIQRKISWIFLILGFTSAVFLFAGTTDDFAPKHISAILGVVDLGHLLSDTMVGSTPAYYVYGAEIIGLLGITGSELLFFPVQILPFIVVVFATYYHLSKNLLFSSAIVLIQIFMQYNGSMVVFFWPHGLGVILLYAILLTLMCFFKNMGSNKLQYVFALIVLGMSLSFISYNNAFKIILILCFFVILAFICIYLLADSQYGSPGLWRPYYWRYLMIFLLVMSIVQLGLSNFTYEQFLSALEASQGQSLSSLDKLLVKFGGSEMLSSPFSEILVAYPRILSYLGMARTFFVFASIFIFMLILYKYVFKHRTLNFHDILCILLLLTSASFAMVRVVIGGGFFPYFYLPAFFCAAWIITSKLDYRYFSYLFVIALLLISALSVYEMCANNLFDSDSNNYQKFNQPSIWHARYLASEFSYSDEFTRNMFSLNQVEMGKYGETSVNAVRLLPFDETLFLIKDNPSVLGSVYYIINFDKNKMSLQKWRHIKSWRYFYVNLQDNCNLDKVYDTRFISIYSKRGEEL